ncbi:MAG: hypothetical protein L7F77_09530, partial [Candidatus Magnetominusculus sp. LBB02]|nr:hypothetical protein [Candidatus Magnetominusculus sp. LBB02]
ISAGIDVLVFTDHDTIWSADEIDALQRLTGPRLRILAGIEVSCLEGHFLAYGLETVAGLHYNMSADSLIKLARAHDAAVVAAHPFRFSMEDGNHCYKLDIDGVEVDSTNTSQTARGYAEKLAKARELPRIYASDSHTPRDVGSYHTMLQGPIDSIKDLVKAIKNAARG